MNAIRVVMMSTLTLLLSPLVLAQTLSRGEPAPDLVPIDLTLAADCRIVVHLRNNGPGFIPGPNFSPNPPSSSIVRLHKNAAPWGWTTLGGVDPSQLTQPAGGTVIYTWLPFPALLPGTVEVRVKVDDNNSIAESNESNNILTKTLTCPGQVPDLVAADITLNTDCRIILTVTNNGPAIVPAAGYHPNGPFSIAVQMDNDGAPWGGTSLWSIDQAQLSQPVGGTVSSPWMVGNPLSLGNHVVKATVDYHNRIPEANEANNTLTKTVNCQRPSPDLVPMKIRLEQIGIRPSSPCNIVIEMKNNGTAIVPDAAFGVAPSTALQMYKDGAPWGVNTLGNLDPSKLLQPIGGTLTQAWAPGSTTLQVAPGEHFMRLDVDVFNNVEESNEANNSLTQRVVCGIVVMPPTTTF